MIRQNPRKIDFSGFEFERGFRALYEELLRKLDEG
jgi:hypothetical protein